MINKQVAPFRISSALLALLPVLLLLANIPALLTQLQQPFVLESAGLCLAFYVLATMFAVPLEKRRWGGYVSMSVNISWLIGGAWVAIFVVIVGSILSFILLSIDAPRSRSSITGWRALKEVMCRTAMYGLSAFVAYGVYGLLGGKSILIDPQLSDLFIYSAAALVNFIILHLIGFGLTRSRDLAILRQMVLLESALLLVPFVLVSILYGLGFFEFTLTLGLVALQLLRYRQSQQLQDTLMLRVRELSILNGISESLSSQQELDAVLNSFYSKLSRLFKATTFFIALYDKNRQMLSYPLVMMNNRRLELPMRPLDGGPTDHVIRTKAPLWIRKDYPQPADPPIDPEKLQSAVYLGVPLLVSGEAVGVLGMTHESDPNALLDSDQAVLQTIAQQAALVIHNITLYDRSSRLAQNLAHINATVQDVMFSLDNEHSLEIACQTALQIAQAQRAAIYLIDTEDPMKMHLTHAVGHFKIKTLPTEMFHPEIYGDHRTLVISEITPELSPVMLRYAREIGFQACAVVGLRSGNVVVGFLAVFHDEAHAYLPTEIDLLEMLGNQLGAARDNVQLLHALEQYANEQSQLVHLSRISALSLELDRLIINVAKELRGIFSVDHLIIGLIVPGKGSLRLFASTENEFVGGETGIEIERNAIPEVERFLQEWHLSPIILQAAQAPFSPAFKQYLSNDAPETIMLTPLIVSNDLIGLMIFCKTEAHTFTDNHRRLAELAALQIATQIHNAQIYTLTESALVQRLQQLSSIEDIAQDISKSLDSELIISNVLEAAIRSTQSDIAYIALFDSMRENLRVTGREVIDQLWQPFHKLYPRDQGLVGRVIQTRRTLSIPNNQTVNGYVSPTERTYRSSVTVPLVMEGLVIGVLAVESAQVDFYSSEQQDFIKSLAGHATITINNARLLEDQRRQIDTLTGLRRLAKDASVARSPQAVIEAVLKTALHMFDCKQATLYDNRDPRKIMPSGSRGFVQNKIRNVPALFPDDLVKHAAQLGEIFTVEDVSSSPFYANYHEMDVVNYGRVLVVPIKEDKRVLDVLCCAFVQQGPFSEQNLNAAEMLAIQAAEHIENARLDRELRDNINQMTAILNSTRDGIILLDRDLRLISYNRQAEHLLGMDLNEQRGANIVSLLVENSDMIAEEWLNPARILRYDPERIHSREYTLTNRSQPVVIKEVGSPVLDNSGVIIGRLLSLHDVTEEKALEKYREKISNMVFHDLRSPLSTIISSLTLGAELMQELSGDSLTHMQIMLDSSLDSANNLLGLVNTLLDIPKLRTGEMTLRREPISLADLINQAENSLDVTIKEAGIRFALEVPDSLHVYVDSDLIRRVLINLIDNAVRYTPGGGRIMVVADNQSGRSNMIRILICDTGPGIPPDQRERIFEEFQQIEGYKPKRGSKGSGLGLTFCKLAVEAHGGNIWVEPKGILSGACIAFTLPLIVEEAAELSRDAETQ